jgi:hypothetical protein
MPEATIAEMTDQLLVPGHLLQGEILVRPPRGLWFRFCFQTE